MVAFVFGREACKDCGARCRVVQTAKRGKWEFDFQATPGRRGKTYIFVVALPKF